jgi:hypothetical protein
MPHIGVARDIGGCLDSPKSAARPRGQPQTKGNMMRAKHFSPAWQANRRERVQRRRASWLACLMVLAAALLACVLPQVASAEPELSSGLGTSTELGASAEPEQISLTPSTTKPYFACPHGLCDAINEPPPIKTATGYALPNGIQLVGSGVGDGYTAEELESAYDIPKTGGAGQTVALIDAYGDSAAESDLAEYRKEYKLGECKKENANKEHCFTKVNEKGEEANYPANSEGWGIETSLDLDMVSAACPECHILLVEAVNEAFSNLGASVNEAVELGATEISNSYGAPEDYEPWCGTTGCAQYDSDYDHPEHENAKHEKYPVVITASTGDYGYDNHEFGAGVSLPSFPSTSPYVIAVGGTELNLVKNARSTEKVWPRGGSGCSAFESTKTTGQKETEEKEDRKGCTGDRTDSDVAADASCATPVSLYDSVAFKGSEHSGWSYECGTSASSPFVAGVEAHATSATKRLGANAFYKKPSMLFHVSEGSNGECGTESEAKWYLCHATKEGYNGPTGMGTPDGVFSSTGPSAVTGSATSITKTEATLNGTVNPNGVETKYYFEYGETTSYGNKTAEASAGVGTSNVEESKAITGLTAGKQYDFRIVATNSSKETSEGANQVFTTTKAGPKVETEPASDVTETTATLNGAVNPEGAETKYYFEYGTTKSYGTKTAEASSGSGTGNVEEDKAITGLTAGTEYHFRIVATNSEGTTEGLDQVVKARSWSAQETPNPKELYNGASLSNVSCTSSIVCVSVGQFEKSAEHLVPLAESWNGTAWSVQEPSAPTEGKWDYLSGVSCTSSAACTAVGYYQNKSTDDWVTLAERWNGTTWSMEEVPNPKEANGTYADLRGVSCASSEACIAVGWYVNKLPAAAVLIEHWNGKEWKAEEPPLPTGTREDLLESISCSSTSACTAVGTFKKTEGGTSLPLAERWNGTTWAVQEPPHSESAKDTELWGVSCPSSTACTAIGDTYNSAEETVPGAESWNGTTWTAQEPPSPKELLKTKGLDTLRMSGMSCTSSTECIAVGTFESKEKKWVSLAESWNGAEWAAQEPPTPAGAAEADLVGVSCTGSITCTGVGGANNVTLAELYH